MNPRLLSLATMAGCAALLAGIVAVRGGWYTAPALGIAFLAGLQATVVPQRPACRRRAHTVPALQHGQHRARRGRGRARPYSGWGGRATQAPSRPRSHIRYDTGRARVPERVR